MTESFFSDAEFSKVCEELVGEPEVDPPWEFFVESHGVTIYRLYNEVVTVTFIMFIITVTLTL